MPQLKLDCPYCETSNVSFKVTGPEVPFSPGESLTNAHYLIALLQCQICGNGLVGKFSCRVGSNFAKWLQGIGDQAEVGVKLIAVFPKPVQDGTPLHIPENVKRFYVQGMENVKRNFDAAGTMFRKALDASLRNLDPSGKGTLKDRIDKLPADVGVTLSMREWAHEIRLLGNEAAHDDDPFTANEAADLQMFTELFLTYVFTLPLKLKERRRSEQTDQSASPTA